MKRIFLIFLLNLSLLVDAVWAIEIKDADNNEFKAAVQLWLENDDQSSLPLLSELAKQGNVAARLLLARIDKMDRAPSDFLDNMPREQRLTLMRSNKANGPFYPSWLEVEAQNNNPLAVELRKTQTPHVDLQTIENLRTLGEPQATDHLIRIAALYGGEKVHRELLNRKLVLEELKPYLYSQSLPPKKRADGVEAMLHIAAQTNTEIAEPDLTDPDTLNLALFLSLGIPYGEVNKTNQWFSMISQWLFNSDTTLPIADLCNQHCPADSASCAATIFGLSGGYYEVVRLDSPLESIISQIEFLKSERARQMTLRRAALMRAEHGGELATLEKIAQQSRCLADLVAEQRKSNAYLY